MQNGTKKMEDPRYARLYGANTKNDNYSVQLPAKDTKTPPDWLKPQYPKEYGGKK